MLNMMQDVSRITGITSDHIRVYVCNLEPTDMIEYGHVLPPPGLERTWFDNLSADLQAYLRNLGITRNNLKLH
jgi:hypothetical protein